MKRIEKMCPMELLGQIDERQILYCHVRSDHNWFEPIDFENWIAFTIVDHDDEPLLRDMTSRCVDKRICYSCSAGELARLTEDHFDEEIVHRQVRREELTGEPQNYEATPMTTSHTNFDEGFWFATKVAEQFVNGDYVTSHQVVCIDCTRQKVRSHLIGLIAKINNQWLPPENEFCVPVYDEN